MMNNSYGQEIEVPVIPFYDKELLLDVLTEFDDATKTKVFEEVKKAVVHPSQSGDEADEKTADALMAHFQSFSVVRLSGRYNLFGQKDGGKVLLAYL